MIKDNCVHIIFYYTDETFSKTGHSGNYSNSVGWARYLS